MTDVEAVLGPLVAAVQANHVRPSSEDSVVTEGRRLLGLLMAVDDVAEAVRGALAEFAEDPSDPDAEALLRIRLRRVVTRSPGVLERLAPAPSPEVPAPARRSVHLGGATLGLVAASDDSPFFGHR